MRDSTEPIGQKHEVFQDIRLSAATQSVAAEGMARIHEALLRGCNLRSGEDIPNIKAIVFGVGV